jgi:regulator of replication initiation timing
VIIINGGENTNVTAEEIVADIKKYIILLEKKVRQNEALETENRKLTKALAESETSNTRLHNTILELRTEIFERK